MNAIGQPYLRIKTWIYLAALLPLVMLRAGFAADLPEIKEKGVLRHLGVPYANFVTGSGDGLDVELVKLFAQHLGVKYEYVLTSWEQGIGDLTGKKVKPRGNDVEVLGEVPVKGDIIANGCTILPWREKIVHYSTPTFVSQVWIVARADSPVRPIMPQGDIEKDIAAVQPLLRGCLLLGKANTCLDPALYGLQKTGARITLFPGGLNDLAPAVIQGEAELTLLDVPDALVALEKFPGKIKVIGPVTGLQYMGCAFAQSSPNLRRAFNQFLEKIKGDGTYLTLVKRYYPRVLAYFPEFFESKQAPSFNP